MPQPQLEERADRVKLDLREIGEAGADDPRLVQHECERVLPSVAGQLREPLRCEPKRPGVVVGERQLALGHVRESERPPQPISDVAFRSTELGDLLVVKGWFPEPDQTFERVAFRART